MNDLLARCTAFLLDHRYDAYLVGGTVRDQALGREGHDIDIAAPSNALRIARTLADHFGGAYYPLDTERETGRVVLPDHSTIDVSLLRGPDISADLAARDFTVNAMARRLADLSTLIDPHDGMRDLREQRLRAVSGRVFSDDPARLLRAFRLAAELGLEIEPRTSALIEQDAGRVVSVAGERARDELLRIFQRRDAADSVQSIARVGLLAHLLPRARSDDATRAILERLGDLAEKTTQLADPAIAVITEYRALFQPDLETNLDTGLTHPVIIKLAALYDDPAAVVADLGALRFRRDEIHYARMLVAERSRVRELSVSMTPLEAHRYFRDSGSTAGRMGLLLLALAEPAPGPRAERAAVVRRLLQTYRESYDQVIAPAPLINGAELSARFGLRGRQIGDALKTLLELQVQGALHTVADAEQYFSQIDSRD